jgi:hypothetical protein
VAGNNAVLSRVTLQYINQAPMFNPLQANTIIPTGTSGIIPTGIHLAHHTPLIPTNVQTRNGRGNGKANKQNGGGVNDLYRSTHDKLSGLSQSELRQFCEDPDVGFYVYSRRDGSVKEATKSQMCSSLLN